MDAVDYAMIERLDFGQLGLHFIVGEVARVARAELLGDLACSGCQVVQTRFAQMPFSA